ncbi:hypothetical protein DRP05_06670 [Archaeoglobales archaeon]|nr:MAG: hypothetical protein DRP05_06670 [Archaeoglobales archaeon]
MNGRIVAIMVVVLFAIAITMPLFVNVSGQREKPEYVHIDNIEMGIKDVNESHANIEFLITIYRSKIVSNATLIANVYDKTTNLLLKQQKVNVPKKGKEGMDVINVTITFEKDKNYNIMFKIEKDSRFVDSRGVSLKGLDTLIPKNKEIKMSLKDVDFEILGVDSKVTTKARFYIETMENYDDVVFHVKAIQYESNILAAEKWLSMDVEKGKTLLVESNLTIPKDYNYLIKLEVWRNGALLKSWSKGLNLAPTKRIPENVTEEKVKFEVKEFVKTMADYEKYPTQVPYPEPTPTPYYAPKKQPGFEVVIGVIALGGAAVWRKLK